VSEITITIEGGKARAIYSDDLAGLCDLGEATITRASHVEPAAGTALAAAGRWYADMSPSGGPCLAGFNTRGDALQAEVNWLQQNRNL
jgi:hypothetical protein